MTGALVEEAAADQFGDRLTSMREGTCISFAAFSKQVVPVKAQPALQSMLASNSLLAAGVRFHECLHTCCVLYGSMIKAHVDVTMTVIQTRHGDTHSWPMLRKDGELYRGIRLDTVIISSPEIALILTVQHFMQGTHASKLLALAK